MATDMSLEDKRLEKQRVALIEKHTRNLRPGWYITTGFFWHNTCRTIAGPFSTQVDAMMCRQAIENIEGHHQYYIDEVVAPSDD
ncbi:hypothetical protein [Mycobacteroides abscessus]|uniref:hypothetical protein n=1 Tax=Mycobacteroides abscessus TaxID=36809 RepID=UPI0018964387